MPPIRHPLTHIPNLDDDVVNLGHLKGNQGDQNYDLPADVDLARFASVVIWCDRFDSAFGAADFARSHERRPPQRSSVGGRRNAARTPRLELQNGTT